MDIAAVLDPESVFVSGEFGVIDGIEDFGIFGGAADAYFHRVGVSTGSRRENRGGQIIGRQGKVGQAAGGDLGIVMELGQDAGDGQFLAWDVLADVVGTEVVGAEHQGVLALEQVVVGAGGERAVSQEFHAFDAHQGTLVIQEVGFDFGDGQGVRMQGAATFGNAQGLGRQEFQEVVVNAHRTCQVFNHIADFYVFKAVVSGAENQDGSSVGHVGILSPDTGVERIGMCHYDFTRHAEGFFFIEVFVVVVQFRKVGCFGHFNGAGVDLDGFAQFTGGQGQVHGIHAQSSVVANVEVGSVDTHDRIGIQGSRFHAEIAFRASDVYVFGQMQATDIDGGAGALTHSGFHLDGLIDNQRGFFGNNLVDADTVQEESVV